MVEMKVKRKSTGFMTITVLSAKGLKDVRHFGGLMGTYVTVRLSGKQHQATRKVTCGGGSPKWHEPFDFKLEGWKESMRPPAWLLDADDESGKFLVEITHAGLLGQRVVGRRLVNEEDAVDLAQKGFTYHSFGLHGANGEDVEGYVNLRLEFRPIEHGSMRGAAGVGAGVKAVGEVGGALDKRSGVAAGEHNPSPDDFPSKLVSPGGTPLPSVAALWKPDVKEPSSDGARSNGVALDKFGEKKRANGRKGERRSKEGEIPLSGGCWESEGGGMVGVGVGGGGGGLRNARAGGAAKGSAANNANNSHSSGGSAGNGRRFKTPRLHSSTLPFQHPKQVHPDMGSRPESVNTNEDVIASTTSGAHLENEDPDSTCKATVESGDLGWPMRKVSESLKLKQPGMSVVDSELPSPAPTSGQLPPSLYSPTTPTSSAPPGCLNTPRGPKNHASLPRVLSHSSPSSDDYDFDPRTYYVAMPSDGNVPPPLYVSRFAFSAPLDKMDDGSGERLGSGRRHSIGGGARAGEGEGGGGGGGSRHAPRRSLSLTPPGGLHSHSLSARERQQQVNSGASSFSFGHWYSSRNSHSNEMASGEGKYFDYVEEEDFPEMGAGRDYVGPDSNTGKRYVASSEYGEGEWADDVAAFDAAYAYDNANEWQGGFDVDDQPHSFAGTGSRRHGIGSSGNFADFDRNELLMSRSGPLLTGSNMMADFGKRRSKSIKESGYRGEGANPGKPRSAMAMAVATLARLVRPASMKIGGGKVRAR